MKYFLRTSEVKVFTNNSHRIGSLAKLQILDFQRIHPKATFPSIKNVSSVVRSWFKVRYISMIEESVLHTQNVFVRRMKNFLRASKVKVFTQNSHRMTGYSEVWQSYRYLNLKNPLESHFSFNKKSFVSRTVTIQSALHYPDLGQCFTNSERIHTTHEKFSTGL